MTVKVSQIAKGGGGVPSLKQAPGHGGISYNLQGQKLGRKGRQTRERILEVTAELIASDEAPISLSAVARKVPLGMTSLYNYFSDLTELLLAVLEPVMASAEDTHIGILRQHWPDEELGEYCYRFLRAFYDFWSRNSRLLHLRNSMANTGDHRLLLHRVQTSGPAIVLMARQMGGGIGVAGESPASGMATVLYTGIERTVTVATDVPLTTLFGQDRRRDAEFYLRPGARMMELAIRDTREEMAKLGISPD